MLQQVVEEQLVVFVGMQVLWVVGEQFGVVCGGVGIGDCCQWLVGVLWVECGGDVVDQVQYVYYEFEWQVGCFQWVFVGLEGFLWVEVVFWQVGFLGLYDVFVWCVQFGVGVGVDVEEVVEVLVVQVVLGVQVVVGVGGGFVLVVVVFVEQGLVGFLDVLEDVVFGQFWWLVLEYCVWFYGQLVLGEVCGGQGEGLVQVGQGVVEVLFGQVVYQVEVEVVEVGLVCYVGGVYCFGVVVDVFQGLQFVGLEVLYVDGQVIDVEVLVVGEFDLFEGVGIGFQGDFDVVGEVDFVFDVFQQLVQGFG